MKGVFLEMAESSHALPSYVVTLSLFLLRNVKIRFCTILNSFPPANSSSLMVREFILSHDLRKMIEAEVDMAYLEVK